MRVTIAQLDPVIGDLAANGRRILEAVRRAAADGADLLVTAELSVIGYPPRDLLRRSGVVAACEAAAAELGRAAAAIAPDLTVLLGHPRAAAGGDRGVRNAITAWRGGRCVAAADKRLLPGYDVFDEDRWFDPAPAAAPLLEVAGRRVGLLLCEDLWRGRDAGAASGGGIDPAGDLLALGAEVLVAMNASPFVRGKDRRHAALLAETARRGGVVVISVNQVGADDDLIFDGRSRVMDAGGACRRMLSAFEEAIETVPVPEPAASDRDGGHAGDPDDAAEIGEISEIAEIAAALRCGIRGYVRKTGHRSVVLGLSGGIDSAVVATMAVWALGPDAVHGLLMPSRYSSDGSIADSESLADRLGIGRSRVPIAAAHEAMRSMLAPELGDRLEGLPDENLQARIRGLALMGWSNATGGLLLATSNKSELAVGYSTLYGDMCGALAPIGDLLKEQVRSLARWLNAEHAALGLDRPPIPDASILKPPSAELRPDQRDEDSLPNYPVLDALVDAYVGGDASEDEAVAAATAAGGTGDLASWCRVIDRTEYKRFQGPVILKVSPRTFGPGRPMPVVMRWRPCDAEALHAAVDEQPAASSPT
ncbi:MAG: NAD+ synthase [Planctomycetota bacterium]|jgi:NAD+ synthase (glutamine-hydrolysing)